MSKKKKVLILFSIYVFSVVFLCIFWMSGKIFLKELKPENLKTSTIDYNSLPVVLENSFRIVVNGLDGNPGLVVNFNEGLTSAKVKMYQSALEVNNGVYVEIQQNSPYSQIMMETGYKLESKYFEYTKAEYTIDIPDGAEVNYKQATLDNKIKLISNLTNEEITEYNYGSKIDDKFTISNGYFFTYDPYNQCADDRTSCITLEDAQRIMNNVLRSYVTPILDDYFSNVSDIELNNRNINNDVKNKLIHYYEKLSDTDKEPYNARITKLKAGGLPVISYNGNEEYVLNSNVDINSLISITDVEDGNIPVTSSNVIIDSNLNTAVPGLYNINVRVTDSHHNATVKNISIRIIELQQASSSTTSSTTTSTSSTTSSTSTTTTSSTTRQVPTYDASPRTNEEDGDDEEETTQSTTRTNQVSGNYNTGTLPRSYSSSRNNSSNNNTNNNANNNTNNNEVLRNVLLTVGSLIIAAALAFTSYQLFFKN